MLKPNRLNELSNEHLLETYDLALELNLEEALLQILSQEIERRGIVKKIDKSVT